MDKSINNNDHKPLRLGGKILLQGNNYIVQGGLCLNPLLAISWDMCEVV